ncbi:MAG: D-amino-acid oxidase [Rhodospirillales bacterium 69-11]|nr:FAD-binding oxidoreductase [Rhodospirillales bacterium]OJW28173.1 MAG: D-amino-acid oxidase [Rhodospirillales bacterium 69-11]
MAPRVDPVPSDQAAPDRTGVVVIGGGIIGTSTAFFLARAGVPVVLCEKGTIAGEQSSRNWGWCRKMGRDPAEIPLSIEAMRLWGEMNEMVGAETGFRRCGIVYLCKTPKDLAKREAWLEQAGRPHQLDSRMLTRAEIGERLPGLTGDWLGALYTQSDGRAEPQRAAPAIARGAQAHGATVLTNCAVRGIETTGGRISGVVTEKGRIACDGVVLAGGIWSRLFAGSFGVTLPQLKVMSSVMRTEKLEGGPEVSCSGQGFGIRKRLDGGYNVANWSDNVVDIVPDSFRFFADFLPALRQTHDSLSLRFGSAFFREARTPRRWALDAPSPFEQVRTYDPPPYQPILDKAREAVTAAFPAFREMKVAESWGGVIDVTPDAVPVISGVDAVPGFFIATGFSGHGFGIGPGAGRLMAQLVMGETPVVDPTPFRFGRYAERPRPRPSPLA